MERKKACLRSKQERAIMGTVLYSIGTSSPAEVAEVSAICSGLVAAR